MSGRGSAARRAALLQRGFVRSVKLRRAAIETFDQYPFAIPAVRNLDELAQSLEKYPDTEIMIIGHTDAIGSADYNQDLSERRSQAAEDYLGSRGVSRARIQTRGLGEEEPVASNEDEYGRSKNRRVEIAITAGDEMIERARSQTGS